MFSLQLHCSNSPLVLLVPEHFPSLMISGTIIGGVVLVVFVTISVVLCIKRASGLDGSDQGLHDKKQNGSVLDSSSENGGNSGHGHTNHTHHGIHHEWKPSTGASTSSDNGSSATDSKPPSVQPSFHYPTMDHYIGSHGNKVNEMDTLGHYALYDSMNRYNVVTANGQLHPLDDHLVSSYYGNIGTANILPTSTKSTIAPGHGSMDTMSNVTYTNLYDTRYHNLVCDLTGSSTINHTLTNVVNPVNVSIDPSSFVQSTGGNSGSNWKPYNGTSTLV